MVVVVALLLLLATVFTTAVSYYALPTRKNNLQRKNPPRPPSPPKLPVLGNLHQVGKFPYRTFARLAKQYNAPLMLFRFGSRPIMIVSTSEAAREVMKVHDLITSDKPTFQTGNRLLYGSRNIASTLYGEYWRQARRLCVLHLLSSRKVRACCEVREEEVGLLVNRIKQHHHHQHQRAGGGATAVNLSELLSRLANDVICRMAFGRKYDGGANGGFRDLMVELMSVLGAFNVGEFIPWLSWVNRVTGFDARVDRVARRFDEFLEGTVLEGEARLEKDGNKSADSAGVIGDTQAPFIDILLHFQKDSSEEFQLERDEVKAIIMDMFLGGTDTTSTLMEWAMSELVKHPRVMKKLQEELRSKIGRENETICEADLDRLDYLALVIKETIRLHPPIPMLSPRRLMQDTTMSGHDVSAGTMILTNAWAIGRDPVDWPESPEEFWPERFLNTSVDFRGQDFQLIPFGAGRRGCPGISFALAVVELAVANLVRSFDWELPDGVAGEDLDMSESVGITAHRRLPLLALPTIVF
ncbi:unnamed protein product [Linum tenue]|uniref:Uncharacterized protein n=1 Tax=Linum tenue TaxID=586396 RepID=A0AAV0KC84_9ROSI|nr:unnamed protein product [Linum tenue]